MKKKASSNTFEISQEFKGGITKLDMQPSAKDLILGGSKKIVNGLKIIIGKYILRINDKRRVRWDLFVMVLATWNCISIPVDVAFKAEVFI